jgi:hypothetical protein
MYKVYDKLYNTFMYGGSDKFKLIGKYLTNFILSVVNFKAPNVNTGLKPK